MQNWETSWMILFDELNALQPEDLSKTVYIRAEPNTVVNAINRQLGHTAGHVGQIVFLSKMICEKNWESLSIPKNKSEEYNKKVIAKNQ